MSIESYILIRSKEHFEELMLKRNLLCFILALKIAVFAR